MDVLQHVLDLRVREFSAKRGHLVLAVFDNDGESGVRQLANIGSVVRTRSHGLTDRRISEPIGAVAYLALRLESICTGVLSEGGATRKEEDKGERRCVDSVFQHALVLLRCQAHKNNNRIPSPPSLSMPRFKRANPANGDC